MEGKWYTVFYIFHAEKSEKCRVHLYSALFTRIHLNKIQSSLVKHLTKHCQMFSVTKQNMHHLSSNSQLKTTLCWLITEIQQSILKTTKCTTKKCSRGLNIFAKCCYEASFILAMAILKSCLCLTQDLLNITIRWHLTRSRSFVVLREQGGIWGDWPRYCGRSLTHLKVQKLLSKYIRYKVSDKKQSKLKTQKYNYLHLFYLLYDLK